MEDFTGSQRPRSHGGWGNIVKKVGREEAEGGHRDELKRGRREGEVVDLMVGGAKFSRVSES